MSDASWSRSTAVAVAAVSVLIGFAVGAALWWGRNLPMGATRGGILALLFGGFATAATRVPEAEPAARAARMPARSSSAATALTSTAATTALTGAAGRRRRRLTPA